MAMFKSKADKKMSKISLHDTTLQGHTFCFYIIILYIMLLEKYLC